MFASLGAYGHLYPMMPLAFACADAGHEAVIATGPPFLGRLPLPTVPGYPPQLELDWAIQETRRRHPDLHDQDFSMAMFADVTAEFAAPTMIEQCERFRPDLVVYRAQCARRSTRQRARGAVRRAVGGAAVGRPDCASRWHRYRTQRAGGGVAATPAAPRSRPILQCRDPDGSRSRAWATQRRIAARRHRRSRAGAPWGRAGTSDRCQAARRDRRNALARRCGSRAGQVDRLVHVQVIRKVDPPSGTRS
jgi:hypothetical protein